MNNLFSLNNKVVMVTGASSGLGRHFAVMLANAGAHVVLTARKADNLNEVIAEIHAAGQRATAVALDVSSSASVKQAIASTIEQVGVPDVLVNNAGQSIANPCWSRQKKTGTRLSTPT